MMMGGRRRILDGFLERMKGSDIAIGSSRGLGIMRA